MERFCFKLAPIFLFFTLQESPAQKFWTAELCTGAPYNFPLPLTIRQEGEADLRFQAKYESEPSTVPIYWMWRVSRWSDSTVWEFEAVHDKVFLTDTSQEVSSFSISHGLNLLTINHGWQIDKYTVRVGLGIVLAHPENVVRGRRLSEDGGIFGLGYYCTGPTLLLALGKQTSVTESLFITSEAMVSASYARIPVQSGDAEVYNVAIHVILGLGYSLEGKRP